MANEKATRRVLLRTASRATALLLVTGRAGARTPDDREEEEEVSAAEDLMREHGVLKRVLLIYDDAVARLETGKDVPPAAIADSARVIRSFIEDYHERLEEDHLFPRFRRAHVEEALVDTLTVQHRAGRTLTDATLRLATAQAIRDPASRKTLAESLRLFVRMYAPHEAREDTVLFPALRRIVSGHEYAALGEEFEKKEHELFGRDGFEGMVETVARIEKTLGLYELAQFTPKTLDGKPLP